MAIASDNRVRCYSERTRMIYILVKGVAVDSVDANIELSRIQSIRDINIRIVEMQKFSETLKNPCK